MAMNLGSASKQQANINVTPTIDVLLVLLIIFMAITPQKPVGLQASLPERAQRDAPQRERSVVLEIGRSGTLRINSNRVEAEDLRATLLEIFARRSDRLVFLKADSDLDFQVVAAAIDLVHAAGVDHIALVPRV